MARACFAVAIALALTGCGGRAATSDGGPDDAATESGDTGDVVSTPESGPDCTGCSPGTTASTVDPNVCGPQLESTTTCYRGPDCPPEPPCSYVVEVLCAADGGLSDAGPDECQAWCDAAAPNGVTPLGALNCQLTATDAGSAYIVRCGGCGV